MTVKILVIGGTNFIGPYVVRRLAGDGHDVTVFHRGRTSADLPPAVKELHGDRRQISGFRAQFEKLGPDVVLDMVAYTATEAASVMETFKGIAGRVVVASSGDVYRAWDRLRRVEPGPPDPRPLAEDSPLREMRFPYRTQTTAPGDFAYDYDKIPVEQAVMAEPELPGTILRLPAVYGPGDDRHRLFGYLKRMDEGRQAILIGAGKSNWRWTRGYVEDVAASIALAVTDDRAAGRIYNVGEEVALTEAEWIEAIGAAAGWTGKVVRVPETMLPAWMAEPIDWTHQIAYDTRRIRGELGFREIRSRPEALEETVEWERIHPPAKIETVDYAAEDQLLAALQDAGY